MVDCTQRFIFFPYAAHSGTLLRMDTQTGETWRLEWASVNSPAKWVSVPEPEDNDQMPVPQRKNTPFHDAVGKQFGS
jgi:hypothetical protein